jgi:hypothetical protein
MGFTARPSYMISEPENRSPQSNSAVRFLNKGSEGDAPISFNRRLVIPVRRPWIGFCAVPFIPLQARISEMAVF